ncbi:uncharacterized protein V6R79_008211 [Siganus canaliculatus]
MEPKLNSLVNEKVTDDDKISNNPPDSHTGGQTGAEESVKMELHGNQTGGLTRPASKSGPKLVEKDEPRPLCALLSSSTEVCADYEAIQSFAPVDTSQKNLQTNTANTEPNGEDLCAVVLLACLFCHPLDCLLATTSGCNKFLWWLSSSLCGCETTTLQPLLDLTHSLCSRFGVRCLLCDCPFCDICLQATECLDLAMEISQMLYH